MALVYDFIKKLLDPFKLLAIFAVLLGIVSQFSLGPWQTIIIAAFSITLIVLIAGSLFRFTKWYMARPVVAFFRNWHEAPPKYGVEETLRCVAQKQATIEIVGRTCFRWLCGDENAFERNDESFYNTKTKLHQCIRDAIESGATIHFILQNPNVPIPFFDKTNNLRLRRHAQAAIASYKQIVQSLGPTYQQSLTLSFTNEVVDNSMVRIKEGSQVTRFIFDISTKFRPSSISKRLTSKPFLVFEGTESGADEFREELNSILAGAIPEKTFTEQERHGHQAVESLIRDYPHYSRLRQDRSAYLARFAAINFLVEAGSPLVDSPTPPISVQLLVTNQCTTTCKMCEHYRLYDGRSELTDDDLINTLESIKAIGTKAVIFSGGEPLARPGLFDLLKYAKGLGLATGLLTNGVKLRGESISSEEASVIAANCSWVQISVDSFVPETYKRIRGGDYLSAALASTSEIIKAGLTNIEVCFTVQKDNLTELATAANEFAAKFPPSTPIRFKFAHGPSGERDFLCKRQDLEEVIHKVPRNDKRTNLDYLIAMINKEYFTYDDLSNGQPLRTTTERYKALGYTCQALRLTCKIDAVGDVYPCCFLFDDNSSSSQLRSRYRIGTLRSPSGRVMVPLADSSQNVFATIWYGNEAVRRMREHPLPVDPEACNYCIRHFYQNEFLNKLNNLFQKFRYYGLAEHVLEDKRYCAPPHIWL